VRTTRTGLPSEAALTMLKTPATKRTLGKTERSEF